MSDSKDYNELLRDLDYYSVFDKSPVSMWIEDSSALKKRFESLKISGVVDFKSYLEANPHEIFEIMSLVQIVDVNQAAVDMLKAPSKDALLDNFSQIFMEDSVEGIKDALLKIFDGETYFEIEIWHRDFSGEDMLVQIRWNAAPGYGESLSRVIVVVTDITDRRKAQLALQESKERYRAVVEGTEDLITIVDGEGKFTFVNHVSEQILGIRPEDCLGLSAFEFIHPEDREKANLWFEDCLKRKASAASTENRQMNRETGASRDFHWTSNFFYNEDGKLLSVVGIARDITELVEATEALRRSEHRLTEAQRMANLGYWDWDAVTGKLEVSDELNAVFAQVPGTGNWSYERLLDIVHPDDKDLVDESLRSAIKTGDFFPFEHKVVLPDGSEKVIQIYGEVFQDEQGKTMRMAGTAQDITERRGTEDQLRESEERFRAIITNSQAIIFIIASDGTFLLSEGKGLSALGLKPGQVVGQSAYDIYKDFPPIIRGIKESLKGKTITDVIDVGNIFFDIFFTPFTDAGENITGTIGMAIDITEEKKSREALARSEQMAAVGEIASGIAHELNNPLATISGCTEVLLQRFSENSALEKDEKQFILDYLEMIMGEVKHSTGILHDLLDFSRIRPVTEGRVDMTELVSSTVNLLQIQSRFNDYHFITTDIDDVPETIGDKNRLRQVLIIFLTNAAEAMPDGGNINVSLKYVEGTDTIRLDITDEGVGIQEEDIERIFEPYYTSKTSERGTGLGLPIARNIMDQHNGEISVESTLNRGATFSMTIPVEK